MIRSMSTVQIEKRIKAIESELAELKAELKYKNKPSSKKGWRAIVGSFAGDPLHAQATQLGRKYRESQRPKRGKR
jgi:hypothetical protein